MSSTGTPRSVADVIRALDADGVTTLLTHRPDLAHPRPTSIAEIAERALTASSLRLAVEALDAWQLRVATAVAAFTEISVRHLVALIEADRSAVNSALDDLRSRALVWGSSTQVRLVNAAAPALGAHPAGLAPTSPSPMTDGEIDQVLAETGDDEMAVLHRLLWESPLGRAAHANRTVDLSSATSPVERLLARRLLRPWDDDHVVLPREVSLRLRGGRLFADRIPALIPDWPAGSSSRIAEHSGLGTAVSVAASALALVDEIGRTSPRPLATGGVSRRDQAALAEVVGDPATTSLLLDLLTQLGLIASSGAAWLPTTRFDTWAASDPFVRWRSLVTAWLEPADQGRLRRDCLGQLRLAPVGAAVAAARLAERLAWLHPLADPGQIEAASSRTVDDASHLGLLAMGLRTSLWDATTDPGFPEATEQFLIQSDLTAVSPGPLTLEVARHLDLAADRESPGPASVHRFSHASIRRALDSGWSSDELLAWFEAHSSTPVPQPLLYLVADVARTHGRIRVRSASAVVTVDDEAMAEVLLRSPRAGTVGLRRLAPTVLAADAEPDEVVQLLREWGHSPMAESSSGEVMTRPKPRRLPAPPTRHPVQAPGPDQLRALANSLLNQPRAVAKAQSEVFTLLGEAQSRAAWIELNYVDDQGRRREATVRVLNLAGGQARLVRRAAGQFVVPLSRVVSARHTE